MPNVCGLATVVGLMGQQRNCLAVLCQCHPYGVRFCEAIFRPSDVKEDGCKGKEGGLCGQWRLLRRSLLLVVGDRE